MRLIIIIILSFSQITPRQIEAPVAPIKDSAPHIILSNGDTAWIKVEKKIVYDTTYQLKKP